LAVVNVTNGPDVDVRLVAFKLCLCHVGLLSRGADGPHPGFTSAAMYKPPGEKSRAGRAL
ncbi:hypothetical protein, partial [uncultured Paracoccus sp.]|uniref:hypothetical protein n=1 Tax=uncultured Paracoccus sp. TaxID=189685 RepID=UPI0026061B96